MLSAVKNCLRLQRAPLKSDTDELDIDRLKTVPIDSYKLSNAVEDDAVKKMYIMNCLNKLMIFRLLILVI